jgi:hypothetical protein
MLRQALMARRAILLIDGLDEGGKLRDHDIERHVAEVLAPQGHVLLATCCPAGIDEERFANFRRLRLAPLTDAQQEKALTQRLGRANAETLLVGVRKREDAADLRRRGSRHRQPADAFDGRLHLRAARRHRDAFDRCRAVQGRGRAMLSRGGVATPAMRRLMQFIFFEAQVLGNRKIDDEVLDVAALSLEAPERLARIRDKQYWPFELFDGRAGMGHYVEVLWGEHRGKRGVITTDEEDAHLYIVTFTNGGKSCFLSPRHVRSSGLDWARRSGRQARARRPASQTEN